MQTHGRAAPVLFQHAAKGNNANRLGRSSTGGSSPAGSLSSSSDGGAPRLSAAGVVSAWKPDSLIKLALSYSIHRGLFDMM